MKLNVPMMRDDVEFDPHQVDGLKWMAARGRCLLADEPGLGKSLQSMSLAALRHHQGDVAHVLVVSPANLQTNFSLEVSKFTHFNTMVLQGDKKRRLALLETFAAGMHDVLIVSYEQVTAHLEALQGMGFDMMVVDEAHYAKTPDAKRTVSLMNLIDGYLVLMTGTPLENAPNELWTLLEMIEPGGWGTYEEFKEQWCIIRTFPMERKLRNGHKIQIEVEKIVGCKDPEGLHFLISKHMLRRPSTVLKLKEPRHIPVELHMGPKQKRLYRQAEDDLGISLTEEFLSIPDNRVLVLRLRQLASTSATIDPTTDLSVKLDVAVEKAIEHTLSGHSHQVLFTGFKATATAAAHRLSESSMAFVHHGGMSKNVRDVIIEEWRNCGGVLCATGQSAGMGMTFTEANVLHVIDKPYTPAAYDQWWKRLWRRGQKDTVLVYEYRCSEIDEVIEKIHARKQKISDEVIDGEFYEELDYDEWLEANDHAHA